MATDWVPGTVTGFLHWHDQLYSLQFDAPVDGFNAGQFIKVGLDIAGERVGRPYSLVNGPAQRPWEIYFNEVSEGPLTPRLSELSVGDQIWVSARTNGIFTLDSVEPGQTLWMLATGTALGVYLSILRSEVPWEKFERVILVHGVRTVPELTYGETLDRIKHTWGDRFDVVSVVSREDHPDSLKGRITDLITAGTLEERVGARIDPASSHVMLCGNSAMIGDAKTILEERGLTRHSRRNPGGYTTEQYH